MEANREKIDLGPQAILAPPSKLGASPVALLSKLQGGHVFVWRGELADEKFICRGEGILWETT